MMIIEEIFHEVQPPGHSFSEARRHVFDGGVKFNGKQVTSMMQEVDVKDGSLFQIGKRNSWKREGKKWNRVLILTENQKDVLLDFLWESLQPDSEHVDRRQTGWGTKTKEGLIASIERIAGEADIVPI